MSPAMTAEIQSTAEESKMSMMARMKRRRARAAPASRPARTATKLHVLHHRFRLLVVDNVGDRQHDGHIAFVLPPVHQAVRFARDIARLMQDRDGALAAV